MSRIHIVRPHRLSLAEARAVIEEMAKKVASRFEIGYAWRGNSLIFERPGVEGAIALTENQIIVEAHLSFWLFPLRGTIEQEIQRHLDEALG